MTVQEVINYLSTINDKSMEVVFATDKNLKSTKQLTTVEYSDVNEHGEPCHPDYADYQRPGVVVMW